MTKEKLTINKDTIIGEILEFYPESSVIIEKYFDGGCVGCPSVNLETLEMAATMHKIELNLLIDEFKKVAEK